MANKHSNDADDLISSVDRQDGTDYDDELPSDEGPDDQEDDGADGDERSAPAEEGPDDDSSAEPESSRQETQEARQPQQPQGLRRLPNGLTVDARQNIVDPRTGQIIARAGSERRMFEKSQRLFDQLQEHQADNLKLKKELADTQFLNGVPDKYGITKDEMAQAFEITVLAKRDLVGAARKIVEMALAQGHNVTEILGNDAGNALEMRAVQRMLDEKLKPVTELHKQTQVQTEEQNRQAAALRDLQDWMDRRPNSDIHQEAISNLLDRRPGMTPDEAYYELRDFARRYALDFSKPLGEQVNARRNRQGARNPNSNRRGNGPLPGNGAGGNAQRSMRDTDYADPNDDWNSIIRLAMGN